MSDSRISSTSQNLFPRPVGENNSTIKAAARTATSRPNTAVHVQAALQSLKKADFNAQASPFVGNKPTLTTPAQALPSEPGAAKHAFTELFARLLKLFGEVDSATLNNRLQMLKAISQAAGEAWTRLGADYQAALEQLEAANQAAEGTAQALEAAKGALAQAEHALRTAQAKLEGLTPGTPEHDAALAEVAKWETTTNQARAQASTAETNHRASLDRATSAGHDVDRIARQVLDKAPPGALPPSVQNSMEREVAAGDKLVALMMRFVELMGSAQETKTETEATLFKEIQRGRELDMAKKADEFAKELEKAQRAQKAAGCLGKIMMAVTAVVGVVATIATGGLAAGLVVAAMAAATPLLDKALKPMMDAVMSALGPVLEAMMKGVSGLLQEMGVDASTAMLVSSVVVSVAIAAAVMGAVALLSAGAGSAIAQKVMAKVGEVASRVMDKLMNSLLGKLLQNAAGKVGQNAIVQEMRALLRQLSQQLTGRLSGPGGQAALTHLQTAGQVANLTGSVAVGTLKGLGAQYEVNASENLSSILLSRDAVQRAQQALSDGVTAAGEAAKTISQTIEKVAESLERNMGTATAVARQIGAAKAL